MMKVERLMSGEASFALIGDRIQSLAVLSMTSSSLGTLRMGDPQKVVLQLFEFSLPTPLCHARGDRLPPFRRI